MAHYEDAWLLVEEIANDHPITSDANEINYCRYCGVAWAQGNYDEALAPREGKPLRDYGVFGHTPHEPDCVWVRANAITESHARSSTLQKTPSS